MKTVAELLTQIFENATKSAYPELEQPQIEIFQSSNKFGDYQFNSL